MSESWTTPKVLISYKPFEKAVKNASQDKSQYGFRSD